MLAAQQGPSFSTRLPPSAQTAYYSGAALRCGLGGLVTVSSGNYHVCMRGARLPELREFIKVPHKQPPAEVRWAVRQGWVAEACCTAIEQLPAGQLIFAA